MRHQTLVLPATLLIVLFLGSHVLLSPAYNGIRELSLAIIISGFFFLLRQTFDRQGHTLLFVLELGILLAVFYFLPALYTYLPYLLFSWFPLALYGWAGLAFCLLSGVFAGIGIPGTLTVTLLTYLAGSFYELQRTHEEFAAESYRQIDILRLKQRENYEALHELSSSQASLMEATKLQERRRMTAEIHDLLGHQLSSAVIQIAALQYLVPDDQTRSTLSQIHDLLQQSMEHVRAVIHHEQATSVQLEKELRLLCDSFTKCRIQFTYTNDEEPSVFAAHQISSVVKEALTNINKHSNATFVEVRFSEFPQMWTLLIKDNGSTALDPAQLHTGTGLLHMERRMDAIGAQLNIHTENGFRIFCRIPKVPVTEVSS